MSASPRPSGAPPTAFALTATWRSACAWPTICCTRLRFSNRDREQILALVENHMRFADVRKMKDSTFKRFVRLPDFDEHLALHRLDCLASHANLELYDYTRERRAAIPAGAVRPPPLINGHDLIAAGFHPGPALRRDSGRGGGRPTGRHHCHSRRSHGICREQFSETVSRCPPTTRDEYRPLQDRGTKARFATRIFRRTLPGRSSPDNIRGGLDPSFEIRFRRRNRKCGRHCRKPANRGRLVIAYRHGFGLEINHFLRNPTACQTSCETLFRLV